MKSLAFFTATSARLFFRRCVPALLGSASLLCLAPLPSAHALAYAPAFTLNPEPPAQGNLIKPSSDYVFGYHFNTDDESKVNGFGIFVSTTTSHTIGIWDANKYSNSNPYLGDLIWQTQISQSSSCDIIGSYCWFGISDGPTLKADYNYVVAATWGANDIPFKLDNVSVKPSTGFRFGQTAFAGPVFEGLDVNLSKDEIYLDYTPNGSPDAKVGFLSVNLSFEAATPTPPSVQAPTPIPMLGVAAAFGWSRKIRRKISSSS